MTAHEWVEIVPLVKLAEADERLKQWLSEHGIQESQLAPDDIRQDVHRTVRGSESVYFLRRSTLERLIKGRQGT